MKVLLKPGWEAKISTIKPKFYPLGNNARQLVDNMFDEIQKQRRPKFITNPTSFSFLIFGIYNSDSDSKGKSCALVDISKFNNLVLLNFYSLLLQSEIIENVQEYINLAVLGIISFIY